MKKLLLVFVLGILCLNISSQDLCKPMGWATENGGVTGGGSATPVVCDSYSKLANALDDESIKVVHIKGEVTFGSGDRITIQDRSDLTIFGLPGAKLISTDLTKSGSGIFYVKRVNNLIIQNIVFEGPGAYDADGYDHLCLEMCENVWVDHCDFQDGMDGNFDIKKESNYVTATWCIFRYKKPPISGGPGGSDDHRYTNLIGSSASYTADRNHLNTTFQYCWWGEGCRERMPRVRYGKIHLLNNLFTSSVSNYCARAGVEANILLEGNYFDNQKEPVDLYKSDAIVAESNNYSNKGSIATQNASKVFSPPYSYEVADPSSISDKIKECAGATITAWNGCSACAGDDPVNQAPTVSITAPSGGESFASGSTITLSAEASDPDGTITKIDFYMDGERIVEKYVAPYNWAVTDLSVGTHTLKVIAYDDEWKTSDPDELTFEVTNTSTPTLTATSNTSQTVTEGKSISSIVFTWGNTATDLTYSSLPAGLTATKNSGSKTLTVTGIPTAGGTFTVSTVGGTGVASIEAKVNIIPEGGFSVTKSGGWFEVAYAEWTPVAGADRYNVYYTGGGVTDEQIDDPLIRSYGTYWRADIPGLSAGTYSMKIVPVIDGVEGNPIVADNINVLAHDRTGFAFSNGVVPGAYKADGTPKDGAVILYLTEKTKNTISLDVTGATENPCVGLQTILEGFKKGKDNRPLIIRMVGQVTDMEYMLNGDIVIENKNNTSSYITFEGIGFDATADGWGIRLKNACNVEIRNIATMNCDSGEGDNIGLQQNNQHVWIHNCDFFYGDAGSDSDQAKGDGALDCKKSTYITFSYNHFWDTGKSNLLGLSEGTTEGLYITYHHNWYDHSDSRHPRVRYYSAHIYNNYYDGIAKYGVGSTLGSSLFVEGNYFRNCKYPILTSMQGSDVYDESKGANDYGDMPTFSSEDGGTIKAYDNYMEGQKRFIPYGDPNTSSPDPTKDFDAYVVSLRNDKVPSSVVSSYGSNTHNNFDTDASVMYSYTAESPEDAKATVIELSGRMHGGDFKWTFDNSVDDASYAVNTALKSALIGYETDLIYIQGEGEPINVAPIVTIESPANGTEFTLGETITITASAIDTDGTVSSVTFYAQKEGETAIQISSDNSSPYTANWSTSDAGSFIVYAKATDNDGKTGTSDQTFKILIDDPNINDAPSVTVSTDKATYSEGSDVVISATATDDNGVVKVEFYNGTTLIKTFTAEPYTFTMSSPAISDYEITAKAYDAEGLTGTDVCSFSVKNIPVGDLVHNYTESGLSSTFYSITGNLSDSKGTVEYNGLTLTQCLKMESATSIAFTAAKDGEFVMVFNSDFTGEVKVDGTAYAATAGVVTVNLSAGDHTITKGNTANLYYMSITYKDEPETAEITIELKAGWNLISLNIIPFNSLTGTVFPNATIVKTFDAFYDSSQDGFLNTLQSIEAGKGYLVYNAIDESITISGTSVETHGHASLSDGWNLIGVSFTESTSIENAFGTELQNIQVVKDFEGFWQNGSSLNSLDTLEPGKAYFVKK